MARDVTVMPGRTDVLRAVQDGLMAIYQEADLRRQQAVDDSDHGQVEAARRKIREAAGMEAAAVCLDALMARRLPTLWPPG